MTWLVIWKDAYGRRHRDRFDNVEMAIARFKTLTEWGEDATLTTEGNEDA